MSNFITYSLNSKFPNSTPKFSPKSSYFQSKSRKQEKFQLPGCKSTHNCQFFCFLDIFSKLSFALQRNFWYEKVVNISNFENLASMEASK